MPILVCGPQPKLIEVSDTKRRTDRILIEKARKTLTREGWSPSMVDRVLGPPRDEEGDTEADATASAADDPGGWAGSVAWVCGHQDPKTSTE